MTDTVKGESMMASDSGGQDDGLPIPDPEWSGRPLADMRAAIEIGAYDVQEWCPTPDGSGSPQQVHLRFTIEGLPADFAIRFKSAPELDRMIAILRRHREGVWGRPPPSGAQDDGPAMPAEAWLVSQVNGPNGWQPFQHKEDGFWYVGDPAGGVRAIPVAPYSAAEAWTVLTWAQRAGFDIHPLYLSPIKMWCVPWPGRITERYDTPEAALAAAVAKLQEARRVD